jgi:1-acyl-sn-glycerol-3-phosphate acyltransferase
MATAVATAVATALPHRASIRSVRLGELNRWWRIGIPIVTPLVRLLFRVRVAGLEHVPLSGPAILAFNHVSVLDGPVLAIEVALRIKRETRFLGAAELFEKRFVGWILRRYDQIPIRRGRGDHAALDEAIATVRRGALLALAPEGRVNLHGGTQGLERIRSGIARIALPTHAPVIPVGIWGTQARWSKKGISLKGPLRPRLALAFGPPILPSGDVSNEADVAAFGERLRGHLEGAVGRARRMTGDTT